MTELTVTRLCAIDPEHHEAAAEHGSHVCPGHRRRLTDLLHQISDGRTPPAPASGDP